MLASIGGYSQTLGSYNILIINSGFGYSNNAQVQFQAMGHTATVVNQGVLDAIFDYSPYDIVVFGYNSVPADITPILNLNENCQLGIVMMRGDSQVDDFDLGASAFWNNGSFQIDNNSHWISQPFTVGSLPLSFTYKSAVTGPTPNTTTLGSVAGLPSLLVHNSYNRVVMPYYGHGDAMPWNADAEQLTNRALCWAASANCCPSTTSNMSVTQCNSYTAPSGTLFTNTGIVTDIIPNAAGCDSVITIDLTILPKATSVDTRTECNSYTWIDGVNYTSSNNTATFNIAGGAANGCDSLVTLDLTINNVSDLSTSIAGTTISSNNSLATFQWLDCDNSYSIIAGETGQSFTPSQNGNYAVELTENGCVDTSACVAITTVGIIENSFGDNLLIYPNPTSGNFSINLGSVYENSSIMITDITGKLIDSNSLTNSQILNLTLDKPKGVYILSIIAGNKKAVIRLIKE